MKEIQVRIQVRHAILTGVFIFGIAFSYVSVAFATAPNPGHNFTEVGGGVVQGDILYGSAADTLAALPKNATASRYLSNSGTTNNPAWAQIDLTNGVVNALPLTNGGTNASLTASNGGVVWSNASQLQILAGTATANKVLMSGSSATPAWSTPTFPNASATARKIIVSDGTNWIASTETYAVPGTSGNILTSNGTNWTSSTPTGTFLGRQVLTSGTTYTPTSGTNTIVIELVGGGGGGGGATAAASAAAAAGGGGSGSYAEKKFTGISGAASYTVAIGSAGSAGTAANGTGGTGGNTTFACPASCTGGAVTVTANGGAGGVSSASGTTILSALGGVGGAVSTSGDLNVTGQPGGYALRLSGTLAVSGSGAPSRFGGGGNSRNTAGAGNAAGNFGAGGGGAVSLSATGAAGGAGTAGVIVVWEYR